MPLVSGCRLQALWRDELKRRGREGSSLTRVFWRFCQTRMLVAVFSLLLTMVGSFVGPVSGVQILLLPFYILLIRLSTQSPAWSPKFQKITSSCFMLAGKLKGKHSERLQSLKIVKPLIMPWISWFVTSRAFGVPLSEEKWPSVTPRTNTRSRCKCRSLPTDPRKKAFMFGIPRFC